MDKSADGRGVADRVTPDADRTARQRVAPPVREPRPAPSGWEGRPARPQPRTTEDPYGSDEAAVRPEQRVRQPAVSYGIETGPSTGSSSRPSTRRARLKISRIDPMSVLRLSFIFSLCIFVVLMVAGAVLWGVLDSIGVFNSVIKAADTLTDKTSGGVRGWLSFSRTMELALLIGAINVVLMTALSTLGAMLYNLCADMVGGVELTLSEQ